MHILIFLWYYSREGEHVNYVMLLDQKMNKPEIHFREKLGKNSVLSRVETIQAKKRD